jgi:hypothetical protein
VERAFGPVLANHVALKRRYVLSEELRPVTEAQGANPVTRSMLALRGPWTMFDQALSQVAPEELRLLKSFLMARERLSLSAHLPLFVRMYRELHYLLAYRFTRQEAMELTMRRAIQRLDGLETKSCICLLSETFKKFLEAWKHVKAVLVELDLCPRAARFEAQLPDLSNETALYELVSIGDSKEEGDAIYRIIDQITLQQNNFLREVSDAGYGDGLAAGEYEVRFLSGDARAAQLLVTADGTERGPFERFVASQTLGCQDGSPTPAFNMEAVEEYVVETYVAGRTLLKLQGLRTPFEFKPEEVFSQEPPKQEAPHDEDDGGVVESKEGGRADGEGTPDAPHGDMSGPVHLVIQQLHHAASDLPPQCCGSGRGSAAEDQASVIRLELTLRHLPERDILNAAGQLYQMASLVRGADEEDEAFVVDDSMSLEDLFRQLTQGQVLSGVLERLATRPVAELQDACRAVIDKYFEKDCKSHAASSDFVKHMQAEVSRLALMRRSLL